MRTPWPALERRWRPVNIDMTRQRGYRSALSACPEPAVVAPAEPAEARLRGVGVDVRPHLDAVAAAVQGTGLPIAGQAQGTGLSAAGRIVVADVRPMTLVQFVQPYPGDRALRPPV
jgi:hypothetical protein